MLVLKPHHGLFLITLLAGLLIAVSSSSWFILWMGLELNLMSFIPLLSSSENRYPAESALKYFLIQALGSSSLLMASTLSLFMSKAWTSIVLLSLLLKTGAAPFHFWLPPVMQGIDWFQCFILMTIQKIAPISMMSLILTNLSSLTLISSSILSATVGALGGLNQTLTRKILAYSSINHMGWMLAAISVNEQMWAIYFMAYSLITLSVVSIFSSKQIFHINQVLTTNIYPQTTKMMLFLSLLSLGGVPPLLGFFPKMMMIQEFMSSQLSLLWLSILLASALLTLFFYLRVANSSLMLSSLKTKYSLQTNLSNFILSSSLLNMSPALYPLLLLISY
uniref:NADH-ubiquinone oxidoreductase chain 2 n=1 Tax=Halocaridina rubra TaxID=373956 RepID=Q09GA0_HALRR|nr:NADH dehydrogenase subunit 2 [Halocaridina rubra]ABI53756.1 NADH dehydrogenase subunit 2 [Halocaridina rubra]